MTNDKITEAIKAKKWVTIQYNDDSEPATTIKPIFTAESSFGDYFVYAWGWHSGEPGYYRFDFDKIRKVIPATSANLDDNEDTNQFIYPKWISTLYDFREDYLPWINQPR